MGPNMQQWKDLYVGRFVEKGVEREFGEATYEAGMGEHDYESDPVEAADEEMSYWIDDGDGEGE